MTDHKFTDAEIVKALECCNTPGSCYKCPYYDEDADVYEEACKYFLIEDVFSLVQRQKAEIEKLRMDHYQLLPDGRVELIPRTDINAIKAEAIKEFAERLKSDLGRIPQHQFTRSQIEWSINTFVKEMTEENNE